MRFAALIALSGFTLIAGVDLAAAQRARPLRPGEQVDLRQPRVNRKGTYSGVKPGKSDAKNRVRRKNLVTWVGFQPRDSGRSRVFVQLTSQVPYDQHVEGDTLIVTLAGARFGSANARRFLDTRFFDTALARVDADRARRKGKRKRRGRGVEIRIKFKNPGDTAGASASMTTSEADGYTYLFLDFHAPSAAAPRKDEREEGVRDAE